MSGKERKEKPSRKSSRVTHTPVTAASSSSSSSSAASRASSSSSTAKAMSIFPISPPQRKRRLRRNSEKSPSKQKSSLAIFHSDKVNLHKSKSDESVSVVFSQKRRRSNETSAGYGLFRSTNTVDIVKTWTITGSKDAAKDIASAIKQQGGKASDNHKLTLSPGPEEETYDSSGSQSDDVKDTGIRPRKKPKGKGKRRQNLKLPIPNDSNEDASNYLEAHLYSAKWMLDDAMPSSKRTALAKELSAYRKVREQAKRMYFDDAPSCDKGLIAYTDYAAVPVIEPLSRWKVIVKYLTSLVLAVLAAIGAIPNGPLNAKGMKILIYCWLCAAGAMIVDDLPDDGWAKNAEYSGSIANMMLASIFAFEVGKVLTKSLLTLKIKKAWKALKANFRNKTSFWIFVLYGLNSVSSMSAASLNGVMAFVEDGDLPEWQQDTIASFALIGNLAILGRASELTTAAILRWFPMNSWVIDSAIRRLEKLSVRLQSLNKKQFLYLTNAITGQSHPNYELACRWLEQRAMTVRLQIFNEMADILNVPVEGTTERNIKQAVTGLSFILGFLTALPNLPYTLDGFEGLVSGSDGDLLGWIFGGNTLIAKFLLYTLGFNKLVNIFYTTSETIEWYKRQDLWFALLYFVAWVVLLEVDLVSGGSLAFMVSQNMAAWIGSGAFLQVWASVDWCASSIVNYLGIKAFPNMVLRSLDVLIEQTAKLYIRKNKGVIKGDAWYIRNRHYALVGDVIDDAMRMNPHNECNSDLIYRLHQFVAPRENVALLARHIIILRSKIELDKNKKQTVDESERLEYKEGKIRLKKVREKRKINAKLASMQSPGIAGGLKSVASFFGGCCRRRPARLYERLPESDIELAAPAAEPSMATSSTHLLAGSVKQTRYTQDVEDDTLIYLNDTSPDHYSCYML